MHLMLHLSVTISDTTPDFPNSHAFTSNDGSTQYNQTAFIYKWIFCDNANLVFPVR